MQRRGAEAGRPRRSENAQKTRREADTRQRWGRRASKGSDADRKRKRK